MKLTIYSSNDNGNVKNCVYPTMHTVNSAKKLCVHVARLEEHEVELYSEELKIAILYAVAYLYEHREDANHNELTLTLRALLFGIRKEGF